MATIKDTVSLYDERSRLLKQAQYLLDNFLYENKDLLEYKLRVIPEGTYAAFYGRHALYGIVINEKYYIYFLPYMLPNPAVPGKNMQCFSSMSIVSWDTGRPIELDHVHINDVKDIKSFLKCLEGRL